MRGSRRRRKKFQPENTQAGRIKLLTNYDLLFLCSAYMGEKHTTLYSEYFTIQGNDGVKGKQEAALWLAKEVRKVLGDEVYIILNKIPPEVRVEERERM